MLPFFDHKKLDSLDFAASAVDILASLPSSSTLYDQLDRASISIPLNIAEGNGKWTKKDRCRFFDIAKGSALECAAALDIAVVRGFIESEAARNGKTKLAAIVRMLFGLIQANDPDRKLERGGFKVGEEGAGYLEEKEKD